MNMRLGNPAEAELTEKKKKSDLRLTIKSIP